MDVAIPLDKMTVAEKLQAIEDIWRDLQRTPDDVPSPGWHADVLDVRQKRAQNGESSFSTWQEAKARLRERAQ